MAAQENLHVIVGLGITGLSCARYLTRHHIPFAVMDTRSNPPGLAELKQTFPDVSISLGGWDEALLDTAGKLIISPGLSLKEPAIVRQIKRGIPVIGDIELFAKEASSPIISITGTNAKSTVTTLVGEMAKASGLNAGIGGNLGLPALDLITIPQPQLYVLELSSFQLETTYLLKSKVATILNVMPDHMDRYDDIQAYRAAKQRIYLNCESAVCNRDDAMTDCDIKNKYYFTLQTPGKNEFGLLKKNKDVYLAHEDQLLMPVRELPILGRHYQANALAALALGYTAGLSMDSMIDTLHVFKGLPHRCQLIREHQGVRWYNDSKGTNVGATLAAIEGLGGFKVS
jgi:UDP-N-acetylmuramoylalanine--D-glutamate ligase